MHRYADVRSMLLCVGPVNGRGNGNNPCLSEPCPHSNDVKHTL